MSSDEVSNIVPKLMLIFITFVWGTTFVLVKYAVSLVPLEGFIMARFVIATAALLPFALLSPAARRGLGQIQLWARGGVLGLLLFAAYAFQTIGLTLTTPANAAFVTGLSVVLVPILGILPPVRAAIRRIEIAAALISAFGLGLMTVNFTTLTVNIGDIIVLGTSVTIAYHILTTGASEQFNSLALTLVQLLTVTLLSFFWAAITNNLWFPGVSHADDLVLWLAVIVTSFLATALAFGVQTHVQQVGVSEAQTALIFALEPVFALIIDIIVGNPPSLPVLSGMMLILLGTAIGVSRGKSEDQSQSN